MFFFFCSISAHTLKLIIPNQFHLLLKVLLYSKFIAKSTYRLLKRPQKKASTLAISVECCLETKNASWRQTTIWRHGRHHRIYGIQVYKITKRVGAIWLAERRICMIVCRHCCDVKMFCFPRANHPSTYFELKNSTSLLYLPISSSVETWKIFRNSCVNFCFAWADFLSEKKSYFRKHLFCKTKTGYAYKVRVQDFATGKNFSFNQCSKQERFAFFSREGYFIKATENFFLCLHILM